MSKIAVDVPELHRLWATGVHETEICRRLGIRSGSWWLVRTRYALPPRDDCSPSMMLSESQVAVVRELWAQGEPEHEIARAAGASVQLLRARLADQMADLPERSPAKTADPTADEIKQRAAAARASWSTEEEERRRVGWGRRVTLQKFSMNRDFAFSALD